MHSIPLVSVSLLALGAYAQSQTLSQSQSQTPTTTRTTLTQMVGPTDDGCSGQCIRAAARANSCVNTRGVLYSCMCSSGRFRADLTLCLEQNCPNREVTEETLAEYYERCLADLDMTVTPPGYTFPARTLSVTVDPNAPGPSNVTSEDSGGGSRPQGFGMVYAAAAAAVAIVGQAL